MLQPIPGLVGWRYIRIVAGSKRPVGTGWQHPNDQPAQVKKSWAGNWGVLAGDGAGAGMYLLCIDQDVKGEADGLAEFAKLGLPPTYHKDTISGGRHSLYWVPPGFQPFKRHDLGLEFLGNGQQFLAPGSVVDGKEYPAGNGAIITALDNMGPFDALRKSAPPAVSLQLVPGNRNEALFKRASYLRGVEGMGDQELWAALVDQNKAGVDPLGHNELRGIWKSACGFPAEGGSPAEPAQVEDPDAWAAYALGETMAEFLRYNDTIPRRLRCLGPFVTAAVAWIFGETGHGKSFFALACLNAMSRGLGLDPWPAGDRPLRVGYVDGEMHRLDTGERIATFPDWGEFIIFHRSQVPGMLNMALPSHQEIIKTMAADLDVLCFDNFHSLAFPTDEGMRDYSPQIWQAVAPLVAWFRDENKLLLICDHANAQGAQQGDRSKQWNTDLALKLDATQYAQDAGLQFDVEIKKGRQKTVAGLVNFRLIGDRFVGSLVKSDREIVREAWAEGLTRKEIIEDTEISESKVYDILRGMKKPRKPH